MEARILYKRMSPCLKGKFYIMSDLLCCMRWSVGWSRTHKSRRWSSGNKDVDMIVWAY